MLKKIILFLMVSSMLASILAACGGNSTDPNKKLLTGLIDKGKVLVNQPGWVHVTEKVVYDTDKADRGSMSNGTVIPLTQNIDIWYHINESKLVYQYVWNMSTKTGDSVELTVFLNNVLYNLTTNITNPLNPYTLTLDYQFADELDYFVSNGGHPVVTSEQVNGKTATVFTLDQKLATPKTTEDYTQAITGIGTVASFDSESGLLLKLVRTVTLADGTKRMFYTDNITVQTGVQPPDDIQNYANGFW
jgi:hypothetical protein